MEELKTLFGEGSLTYDEFATKLGEGGFKLANLKTGSYVDRAKLDKANSSLSELQSKYNELIESTKDYEAEKKELEDFRAEKANKELMAKIAGANIDSKFSKFVLSEIKSSMGENDEFEDALAKYVKENPQYLTTKQGVFKFGTTSPNLEGGGSPSDNKTINQTMNEILRNRGEK